jgi:hypothetical protein
MYPSGLFWVESSFGSLNGTCSLRAISATDFADPQPPTGPLYGLIDGDLASDVISASSQTEGQHGPHQLTATERRFADGLTIPAGLPPAGLG